MIFPKFPQSRADAWFAMVARNGRDRPGLDLDYPEIAVVLWKLHVDTIIIYYVITVIHTLVFEV